ncbi:hypothetical protein OTSANNIE_0068 [Anaplasma phagocytophilum str. Annie]|nr:hypothetical protein APHHGE2_0124 [Anaplasma phagocytophilum str. HGE2]KJV86486.1 hypothetical protein APHNYW_1436 [Anaplasma phagocytophilum str. ApNYW]KJV99650.1 hypothetical protein OTSANNIE_0068 [Anaplasma phagocytophilum str. Annie]
MTLALWILVVRSCDNDLLVFMLHTLFLSAFIACFGHKYSSYVSY